MRPHTTHSTPTTGGSGFLQGMHGNVPPGHHNHNATGDPSDASTGGTATNIKKRSTTHLGRGGGSHQSISPDFKVNSANGTMTLSLPIHTAAGRAGFGPSLALSYDSGSGNGPFGLGWSLQTQSISRKISKGIPRYDDSDTFVISGAEDLVSVSGTENEGASRSRGDYLVTRFRPRVETEVVRIERWEHGADPDNVHWRTISSSNVTTFFGESDESRIVGSSHQGYKQVFSWLASRSIDSAGNAISFEYKAENSQGYAVDQRTPESRPPMRYLKRIRYGNRTPSRDLATWTIIDCPDDWMFEVVLDYGDHDDEQPLTPHETREWQTRKYPFSSCRSGFEIRMYRLCRRVLMFHRFPEETGRESVLVSSTEFEYDDVQGVTLLASFTAHGYLPSTQNGDQRESLPPVQLSYTSSQPDDPTRSMQLKSVPRDTLQQISSPTTGWRTEWVDLDGEGMSGSLLAMDNGSWWYQRNRMLSASSQLNDSFGPLRELLTSPHAGSKGDRYFEDLDHDGKVDVVYLDRQGRIQGFQTRRSEGDTWESFTTIPSIPNVSFTEPATKRIDLTGDGFLDILRQEESGELTWYQSLGKNGFAPGRRLPVPSGTSALPRLHSSDPSTAVYLADMTGDGLVDIVQIQNSKVLYWPNMGYGRFGNAVTMSSGPRFDCDDQFTQSRLRLTDISGTGTADLVYLPATGGIVMYYNLAGNGWSEPVRNDDFPIVDNLSSVFALDLLGNGTSCLCWSGVDSTTSSMTTSRLQYVELTGGQKPHLLSKYTNGLGATTEIAYQPSTKYYLEDEERGTPWRTRLPFPVHCVSRIVDEDLISQTKKVTRYAYRDGYYDGVEREFRGFSMVERWDDEELGTGSKYLQRPPVHTKEWFHTGAIRETRDIVSGAFGIGSNQLAVDIDAGMSARERYEFHRALKGSKLREELYSDDGSVLAGVPYYVQENSYEVRPLQPFSNKLQCGICKVLPRESRRTTYERRLDDPQIHRDITLQVDDYGDVLKALQVSYGRTALSNGERRRKEQGVSWATYSDKTVTNAIDEDDAFYAPMTASTRSYVIKGIDQIVGRETLLEPAQYINRIKSIAEVSYDHVDTTSTEDSISSPSKALIDETRVYYLDASLTHRLPLGQIEAFSQLDQSYQLVFDSSFLQEQYLSLLTVEAMHQMLRIGGYVCVDSDDRWWTPSSKALYYRDGHSGDVSTQARRSFFQPSFTLDPFGAVSVIELDKYYYLPAREIDAMGNEVRFRNSYWHLQPVEAVDINCNHQQVVLNGFGAVIATAQLGEERGEMVGDTLEGLSVRLTDDELEKFIQDPCGPFSRTLLGQAGSRVIHYPGRFYRSQQQDQSVAPGFYAELTSDIHGRDRDDSSRVMVSITYLDGHGQLLQNCVLHTYENAPSQPQPQTNPREREEQWRISEWIIKDSKGNPVRVCQPSFTSNHDFHFEANMGSPKTTSLLDPLDRKIGVLYPDHTWSKTRFQPWSTVDWDVGATCHVVDPALDEDVGAFLQSLPASEYLPTWLQRQKSTRGNPHRHRHHVETARDAVVSQSLVYKYNRSTRHLDSRGKVILSEVQVGREGKILSTQTTYNMAGYPVAEYDCLKRLVQKSACDRLGRTVAVATMDAGESRLFLDCMGNALVEWKHAGKTCFLHVYDALRRETELWVEDKRDSIRVHKLMHRTVYGRNTPENVERNLNGQTLRLYDQSGVRMNDRFDFKGNCLQQSFCVAEDYRTGLEGSEVIYSKPYVSSETFDALNRAVRSRDATGCTVLRRYDHAGNLAAVSMRTEATTSILAHQIVYAADGLVQSVEYGNGVSVVNVYEDTSRRLLRQTVTRARRQILQDLQYWYDCMGRLVRKIDRAQQSTFFRNTRIHPAWSFRYDARGQLVHATGRERLDCSNKDGSRVCVPASSAKSRFSPDSIPGNGRQMCQYEERYRYDDAGNILSVHHAPLHMDSASGWKRRFIYQGPSALEPGVMGNKLTQSVIGEVIEDYEYSSSSGCITSLPGFSALSWDAMDRLRSSSCQRVNEGDPETTWYVYNSGGERVRKVTDRVVSEVSGITPTKLKETLYLPGLDLFRRYAGDGQQRTLETIRSEVRAPGVVVIHERKTGERTSNLLRFQVGEHLELDDAGQLISYEEFSPFGSTMYLACGRDISAPRKYRYAAYERDVETGFFFCQNRYYAPWLGRWLSPDPLGLADGMNLYCYVGNDPVNMHDPSGTVKTVKGDKKDDDSTFSVDGDKWKTTRNGSTTNTDATVEQVEKIQKAFITEMNDLKTEVKLPGQDDSLRVIWKMDKEAFMKSITENMKNYDHAAGAQAHQDVMTKVNNVVRGEDHHMLKDSLAAVWRSLNLNQDDYTITLDRPVHTIVGGIQDKGNEEFAFGLYRKFVKRKDLKVSTKDLQSAKFLEWLSKPNRAKRIREKLAQHFVKNKERSGLPPDVVADGMHPHGDRGDRDMITALDVSQFQFSIGAQGVQGGQAGQGTQIQLPNGSYIVDSARMDLLLKYEAFAQSMNYNP